MSAWGAPTSAWSSQVEEEESAGPAGPPTVVLGAKADDDELFPTLGAAATKPVKKKKDKGQKMNLNDFNTGKFSVRARAATTNDDDILASLPKGPSARGPEDEELGGALGGAFRDYGGDRGGGGDRFQGGGRGEGEERRFQGGGRGDGDRYGDRGDDRGGFDDGPSRADESRNWGAERKFVPSNDSDRRGPGGPDDRPPRTDVDSIDDWGASKKFVPSTPDSRDSRGPRDAGADGGRWGRAPAPDGPGRAPDGPDRWGRGDAAPSDGGRPKLNLAPRTERPKLDLKPRDESAAAAAGPPKNNPFGGARPREVALAEKGRDWKKEDFALARLDRPDTDEEKAIKKDIVALQARVLAGEADELCDDDTADGKPSADDEEEMEYPQAAVSDVLLKKEAALLKLSAALDDKVRFAQKSSEPREKKAAAEGAAEEGGAKKGANSDR
eukprot:CAMPEP_0182903486 /NCGR_PEP_ID=MMETSP0034_2-20130328/31313_1 /TAXON_ID=156128 /ORGANISM="Nephroselmis pyriformis, Strain CCMP717" /LENGTH=440 /DNA_ID=CAMNT_0025038379 /DNA_START=17 /DNA_END=1336 /DNA_ORIENTATION=+